MDVVAAGVHQAAFPAVDDGSLLRGEGERGLFRDGQGVHVAAHHDDGAGLSAVEDAEDARPADARADLQPQALEPGGDDARRPLFLLAELGVGVDVAPDGDELRRDPGRRGPELRVHGLCPRGREEGGSADRYGPKDHQRADKGFSGHRRPPAGVEAILHKHPALVQSGPGREEVERRAGRGILAPLPVVFAKALDAALLVHWHHPRTPSRSGQSSGPVVPGVKFPRPFSPRKGRRASPPAPPRLPPQCAARR